MNAKNFSALAILTAALVSGCSSVKARHYGTVPLESLKTACVILAPKGNPHVAEYIDVALAHHNVKTRVVPMEDKPADAEFYVTYTEHWNWDVTVYLQSLDVQFLDNKTAQVIATGSFRQGFFHSFPDPRTKTFEVVDDIYNAK